MLRARNKILVLVGQFITILIITFISFYLINLVSKTLRFQVLGELINHFHTPDKVVALTYDDGPNPPYTNQLIDILERNQIKATFFVIGQNLEKYPETAQLLLLKGHELGNHSYSHKRMVFKNHSFVKSEIEKTDQLIHQLGVTQEIHFRAPYGRKLLILPYVLAHLGKKNILWDVNPKDYQATNSEAIENYVVEHTNPGSIIILHDGGGERSQTVAATARLIAKLQAKGYTFKTVSELIHQTEKR